jgi:arginine N-succinyltransferase
LKKVRVARASDFDALMSLASQAKVGLTTLPEDPEVITERLQCTALSFRQRAKCPGGEFYWFVLEDESGQVQGTAGVVSKTGGFDPHWTYAVEEELLSSKVLNSRRVIKVLKPKRNHSGPTEVGTLFLNARSRGGDGGRLLSLSRFLFMSMHRPLFENSVIAELRGRIDERGRSVFWESIGHHFFGIEFKKADVMVMKNKRFIEELMPRYPIYIPMLPPEARMVIGEVHDDTRPAYRLLQQEGFIFNGEVDIFEAGPVVASCFDDIRTIRESSVYRYVKGIPSQLEERRFMLTKEGAFADFECIASEAELSNGELKLPEAAALALSLQEGDRVRLSPLRGEVKR